MPKLLFILSLFTVLLFSHQAYSQSTVAKDMQSEDSAYVKNQCTPLSSAKELLAQALKLKSGEDETEHFFAANCAMIASYKGHSGAQQLLAEFYRDGIGVPVSNIHAYKWAQIAVSSGNDDAKDMIAALEATMSIDDLNLSREAIQNYISFEQSTFSARGGDTELKNLLISHDISNLTSEQMEQLSRIQESIDRLFAQEGLTGVSPETIRSTPATVSSKVQPKATAKVSTPTPTADSSRELAKQREERLKELERQREERARDLQNRKRELEKNTSGYTPKFTPPTR